MYLHKILDRPIFLKWEKGKLCSSFPFADELLADSFLSKCSLPYIAFNTICEKGMGHMSYVIVMSATPKLVREALQDFNEVHIRGTLKKLKEKERKYYTTSAEIPLLLSQTGRTVIYVSQIKHIIKLQAEIKKTGKSCIALWSLTPKGKNKKMSKTQLAVRETLLNTGEIPSKYDVLIINDAYQTCLNIEPKEVTPTVDTVIVNTSQSDTITQARGRVRHDIDTLYILDKDNPQAVFYRENPDEFLDKPLSKDDKEKICRYFGIKDDKSQLKKFPYVRKHIDRQKYKICSEDGKEIIRKL